MTTYPKANRTAQWFSDTYSSASFIPKRVVWHSTETTGWPGYGGGSMAPNYTVKPDFANKALIWRAHYEDEESSRALVNLSGGVETNRYAAIQIEMIGTCDPKHKTSWNGQGVLLAGRDYMFVPAAPDWYLQGLADFSAYLFKKHGLKMQSGITWKAYPDSYGADANRFTFSEWLNFLGHCGHQHVPENDHGDPGNFNAERMLQFARAIVGGAAPAPAPSPTTQEWYLMSSIPSDNLAQIQSAVANIQIEHPTLKDDAGKPVTWSLAKANWSEWYYSYFTFGLVQQVLQAVQGDQFDEADAAQKTFELLKPVLDGLVQGAVSAALAEAPNADATTIANLVVSKIGAALAPETGTVGQ